MTRLRHSGYPELAIELYGARVGRAPDCMQRLAGCLATMLR